jgi:hypothetical protein
MLLAPVAQIALLCARPLEKLKDVVPDGQQTLGTHFVQATISLVPVALATFMLSVIVSWFTSWPVAWMALRTLCCAIACSSSFFTMKVLSESEQRITPAMLLLRPAWFMCLMVLFLPSLPMITIVIALQALSLRLWSSVKDYNTDAQTPTATVTDDTNGHRHKSDSAPTSNEHDLFQTLVDRQGSQLLLKNMTASAARKGSLNREQFKSVVTSTLADLASVEEPSHSEKAGLLADHIFRTHSSDGAISPHRFKLHRSQRNISAEAVLAVTATFSNDTSPSFGVDEEEPGGKEFDSTTTQDEELLKGKAGSSRAQMVSAMHSAKRWRKLDVLNTSMEVRNMSIEVRLDRQDQSLDQLSKTTSQRIEALRSQMDSQIGTLQTQVEQTNEGVQRLLRLFPAQPV